MIDTGNHDPSEAVQVGSKFSNDLLLASKRTAHVPSFDQRMGLCSVHNKIRSVQNLHFDADGHYKCTPSSVCALGQREKQRKRSLGNGMMSNHKGHTNYSEMLANSGGSYGREAENSVRLSSQFSNPSCSPHHPPLATMSGFFDVSAYTPLNCSNKNPSVVHTGTLMGRDISSQNMSTSMNQSVGGSYQNLALAPSPGGSMYGSMSCQNTCSPPGYPSHGLMGSCSRPALNHHRLLVPSLPKVQEELDRTTRDLVTNSNKLGPTLRTTIPCAGEPGCLQETQALYRDGNYHRIMERNKVHCADHASAVSYTPHTGLTLAGEHPPVPFDRTQCTQMARSTRALHAAARTSHRHVTKLSVLENSSVEKHICVVHQKQRLAMYMLASPELGGWVCRPEHTCCVSRTERYNTNGKSSSGPDKREDERLDVPERDSATSELFLSNGEDIATSSETKKKRL